MFFHSPEFILLCLVTLLLFIYLRRLRIPILAGSILLFYAASGWPYLLLFLGVSALTHGCALLLHRHQSRLFLWIGLGANLLNLLLFKYVGFLLTNLQRVLAIGIEPSRWQWVLPLGISFYTFQLIAYLVDVAEGRTRPAQSFVQFWVFIAFFGHLVAGPIMRGKEFLPQVEEAPAKEWTSGNLGRGLGFFALGMVKKLLIADMLAPKTDAFFGSWAYLTGVEAWIAGWLFAFQIYYDFSAYSEMALGIGYLFGFDLAVNFRTPYLAPNPSAFWERWHITLSSWIRDYIYIPLGGNRKGEARAYLNLVIAMALSGLWHGAAWTFIAWGLFHGLLSIGHKFWVRHVIRKRPASGAPHEGRSPLLLALSVLLMFLATTVGWILFRADGLRIALALIEKMFSPATWVLTPLAFRWLPIVGLLALLHGVEAWFKTNLDPIGAVWSRRVPAPLRALAYTGLGALLFILTQPEQQTFIYFRF